MINSRITLGYLKCRNHASNWNDLRPGWKIFGTGVPDKAGEAQQWPPDPQSRLQHRRAKACMRHSGTGNCTTLFSWNASLVVPSALPTLTPAFCCRRGTPSRGGLLSNTWKWLARADYMLTKQETLLGRGAWVESWRVREPRRTALLSESWVLWWWD